MSCGRIVSAAVRGVSSLLKAGHWYNLVPMDLFVNMNLLVCPTANLVEQTAEWIGFDLLPGRGHERVMTGGCVRATPGYKASTSATRSVLLSCNAVSADGRALGGLLQ
jgi:hypothetical protein